MDHMFPGMLTWVLWKEQNNYIFWDKRSTEEDVWNQLVHNIQETVRNKKWGDMDKYFSDVEARIVVGWGIEKNDLGGDP